MGSQLKGNRVKLDKAGFDPTGDDAKDLGIIRMGKGGKTKSKVNQAGNYTQPTKRKRIFNRIKAQASHGTGAGKWSARKAQALAKAYKKAGGGYK